MLISKLNRPDLLPKKIHLKPDAVPTLFEFKDDEQLKPAKRHINNETEDTHDLKDAVFRAIEVSSSAFGYTGPKVRSAFAKRQKLEVN